jgi:3-dehydroquinate dehydratase/shikimate dehydrogenase
MTDATLVATLTTLPSPSGADLTALPDSVSFLEVRADLVGDMSAEWLRSHFKGRLLYALRSQDEGGNCSVSQQERDNRLVAAAQAYDLVELEGQDLSAALMAQIPVEKRLLSWHGQAADESELVDKFTRLSATPARAYKLVSRAPTMRDEFTCLSLLKSLGRSDTIAYSTGPLGFWSRLIAPQLGAPMVFGLTPNSAAEAADPAEPSITRLIEDYGLPALTPITELFAIIGNPIFHSLSPRLHNAAYRAMTYPALFLPLRVESFTEFWRDVVQAKLFDSLGMSLNGMTVASPHKESALQIARMVSPMAQMAESVNILVRNNGWWKADTTDPEVIFMANRERSIEVSKKRAAVIGCGGAGRAIARALVQSGAGVTLINRGPERGNHAAELLGLPYIPLLDFDAAGYDIVVNATPVGRDSDEAPFKLDKLNDEAIVIDLVYGARPTPLIANTLAHEQIAIDGRDVLLTQVLCQFQMMTGQEMPTAILLDTLGRGTTGDSGSVRMSDKP